MQLVAFEDAGWRELLPLTYLRSACELRCGCDTLLDKIRAVAPGATLRLAVRTALRALTDERYPDLAGQPAGGLWINGRLLLRRFPEMPTRAACWRGDTLLAAVVDDATAARLTPEVLEDAPRLRSTLDGLPRLDWSDEWGELITYPWDLIARNAAELRRQVDALPATCDGRIDAGAILLLPRNIRIGPGSRIKPGAVLDAEEGPIHIGANVTISPTAVVRGPCSLGDGVLVQSGAYIREGTSIGPVCKIGGEIEASIFQGYSNKQHDGFVGHSYVGEWVNLGADTVTSDLKNTYGSVVVPINGRPIDSGQMFVGSIIGDHVKTGICTALTTGCVIGLCSNVVVGRPPRWVRSFSWLTERGAESYRLDRAIEVARRVMARRRVALSSEYEAAFRAAATAAAMIEER